MIFKKILHTTLNESGAKTADHSQGENWFYNNTNLIEKKGKGYIKVTYTKGKKLITRTLPTFLKTDILGFNFFDASHIFFVDLSKKYDAILEGSSIVYEKSEENPNPRVDLEGTAPFYFELKNYSTGDATGKYIMQSSRISTFGEALKIAKSLLENFNVLWESEKQNPSEEIKNEALARDMDITSLTENDILGGEGTTELRKSIARKLFLKITEENQETITMRLSRQLKKSIEEDVFFSFLVEILNGKNQDRKAEWKIPANYYFLLANHEDAENNFVDTVNQGLHKFDKIKEFLKFRVVTNKRIKPFKHIELAFEEIKADMNSTEYKKNNIINEILEIAGETVSEIKPLTSTPSPSWMNVVSKSKPLEQKTYIERQPPAPPKRTTSLMGEPSIFSRVLINFKLSFDFKCTIETKLEK